VLTINPFDIEATADALHAALEMPAAERRRRLERGREILREHDMRRWVKRQHEDLVALRGDRRERKAAG
jgi:trehalose 6-phosphate synthase